MARTYDYSECSTVVVPSARPSHTAGVLLRTMLCAATCLLATVNPVEAQQPPPEHTDQAAFETASIRPAHQTDGCFSMLPSGSAQYAITCVSLRVLVQIAYKTNYIDGGGSALDSFYDLRATLPDGKPWTPDATRPMLQHLLEERFHLVAHGGKRELPGYELVVAKSGPKLHAVPPPATLGQKAGEPAENFIMADRIQGRGVGAGSIATLISVAVHAPVVDHTGLTGTYNVDLRFAPDNDPDANAPSLFTAVEEQLGLQLKAQKITVDTLVIDHADATPTPN